MKHLAEQPMPELPANSSTRLKEALRKAYEASLEIVRNDDISEEVAEQTEMVWRELVEMARIYAKMYDHERWWAHHYYHKLYGVYLEDDVKLSDFEELPKAGEIIDFADILRKAQEHNEP